MHKMNTAATKLACCALPVLLCAGPLTAAGLHHYVFFAQERERITEPSFLQSKFEGAQLKYVWRELEPQKNHYNFEDIQHDLAYLQSHGKKLFIQIQDCSFALNIRPFPRYLLEDASYHGGADKQYGEDNSPYGWMARRWDKAVQERFQRLLLALGDEFDGRIEGINLPETAFDVASGPSGSA